MLVVTDLDGTLLDHHTYSHAPATAALAELARRNIPVVLNTSKTRTELVQLLPALQLNTPFIVENGSAVYQADGEACQVLGVKRPVLLETLDEARRQGFEFRSYRDLRLDGVMAQTGLDRAAAKASLDREFTEPLVWQGTLEERREFISWIQAQGLQCLEGGRFLHAMGRCDKGVAMQKLRESYYPDIEGPVVALGDSENDLAMLKRADIAVCIRSTSGRRLRLESGPNNTVLHTLACGPEGWAEAISDILQTN